MAIGIVVAIGTYALIKCKTRGSVVDMLCTEVEAYD